MANKKKAGKPNWNKIKHDYCTDPNLSLQGVCKKYGVSMTCVRNKSKAESWFATKKETQAQIAMKAITKTIEYKADKLANEMIAADMLSDHILRALQDENQFKRYIVPQTESYQDGTMVSESVEKVYEKVDAKSLKDIAAALKTIEEMKRGFYNIMKADALNRDRREEERLAMERERLEMDKAKSENQKTDNDITVIIKGHEPGWEE